MVDANGISVSFKRSYLSLSLLISIRHHPPNPVAYFTEDTASRLRTVDDIPHLASMVVPYGLYKSARSAKGRPDSIFNPESGGSGFSRLEYVPYMPRPSPSTSNPDLTVESSEAWQNKLLREQSTPRRSGPSSTTSSDENLTNALVPLSYLQDQPLVRREPTDQILLKKLDSYYDRQDQLSSVPDFPVNNVLRKASKMII